MENGNNQEVKNQGEVDMNALKSAKPTIWDKIKAHKGAAIAAAIAVGTTVVAIAGHALAARQGNDSGEEEDLGASPEEYSEEE